MRRDDDLTIAELAETREFRNRNAPDWSSGRKERSPWPDCSRTIASITALIEGKNKHAVNYWDPEFSYRDRGPGEMWPFRRTPEKQRLLDEAAAWRREHGA